KDVISWLLKDIEEKDLSTPPGDQALNEDGRLNIIAGRSANNSSTGLRPGNLTLLHLQKELDEVFESNAWSSQFTDEKLQGHPYLEAVINETLRLKPAVPSGQPRVNPPERLQIDEVWIPGETIVVPPQYVLQRDERCFLFGSEFIPEPWLDEKSNLINHEQAFLPFRLGRYGCVGKQLANMQLRGATSWIAYDLDIAFATIGDEVAFYIDCKDTFTFTIGPLN
ncbi:hypothetical protein N7451_007564, partial [Penicillium sp. IBT 35674x]